MKHITSPTIRTCLSHIPKAHENAQSAKKPYRGLGLQVNGIRDPGIIRIVVETSLSIAGAVYLALLHKYDLKQVFQRAGPMV